MFAAQLFGQFLNSFELFYQTLMIYLLWHLDIFEVRYLVNTAASRSGSPQRIRKCDRLDFSIVLLLLG